MATSKKTDMKRNPEKYFTSPAGHIKDRIVIHESVDIPKEGMFISLNGYPFLVRPGEEVDIPRPVRKMLDTRITRVVTQDGDGKDHIRDVPRIMYTLVKEGVNIEPTGDEAEI